MSIQCAICGHPLGHVNEACPQCLPNFYSGSLPTTSDKRVYRGDSVSGFLDYVSDTPRTDGLDERLLAKKADIHDCYYEALEHGRQLERELAQFSPVNGNRADTSLENWFPLSAEYIARLEREHANALGTAADLERKLAQSDLLYAQVLLGQRNLKLEVIALETELETRTAEYLNRMRQLEAEK